jgi:HD-like signal output (HDOD) protein
LSGFDRLAAVTGMAGLFIALIAVIKRRQEASPAPRKPSAASATRHGPGIQTPQENPAADAPASGPAPGAREIQRSLYALAFDDSTLDDPGRTPSGGHAAHAAIVAASIDTLRNIDARPRYAPRRPDLLPQLLQAMNDEDSSVAQIAKLIGKDPAIAGNLLRIANSPLYRVSDRPVESIERAMALIGSDGMRAVIAAALFQPVLDAHGRFARVPELVWKHCLHSALAAEAYAAHVAKVDPFAAQLLALVLGLGSIVTLRVVLDEYAACPGIEADAGVTIAILDSWAGPTASRIAASWGLSTRIQDALQEQLVDGETTGLSPLGRSLRFGRMAAALSMIVASGGFEEDAAVSALGGAGPAGLHVRAIWTRLRNAQD